MCLPGAMLPSITSPWDLMTLTWIAAVGSSLAFSGHVPPPTPPPKNAEANTLKQNSSDNYPPPLGYKTLLWFPMALERKIKQLEVHQRPLPISLFPVPLCTVPSDCTPSARTSRPRRLSTQLRTHCSPSGTDSCTRHSLCLGTFLPSSPWDLLLVSWLPQRSLQAYSQQSVYHSVE